MDKYCINKNYTIKETIEKLEQNHDRVVIVVNDENRVIGVVSQGDIIKALSSGMSIYAMVGGIIKPGFFYLEEKNMEKAYKVFKKKKITLMPIVDGAFKLIDVITLDDIYNYLEGGRNEHE